MAHLGIIVEIEKAYRKGNHTHKAESCQLCFGAFEILA